MGILFGLFLAAFTVQILFLLVSLVILRPLSKGTGIPSVSVVICARNELDAITENLPAVLSQDYPSFEVVVVDDGSEDGTLEKLKVLSSTSGKLRVIERGKKTDLGKKGALTDGILAASGEVVLLTDADCKPEGDKWIRLMASAFSDGTEIALGYGPYAVRPGFLNRMIRWDTVITAQQYFTFARLGMPYMGVGRNLAYRRKFFLSSARFRRHGDLLSGDDDLFINENASGPGTRIVLEPGSRTVSTPETAWRGWIRQKQRHITTAPRYRFVHKFLLALLGGSHILFYVCLPLLLMLQPIPGILIAAFLCRLLVRFAVFSKVLQKLGEKRLMATMMVSDIFYPFFQAYLAAHLAFSPERRAWN